MSKINQIIVNPEIPQTPKSSKETLNSLKKELEVLGGKVFLGLGNFWVDNDLIDF